MSSTVRGSGTASGRDTDAVSAAGVLNRHAHAKGRYTMYRCLVTTMRCDAPGVNAVIRAVTRIAVQRKVWKVYGARRGFPGILNKNVRKLGAIDLRFILDLRSSRRTFGTTSMWSAP